MQGFLPQPILIIASPPPHFDHKHSAASHLPRHRERSEATQKKQRVCMKNWIATRFCKPLARTGSEIRAQANCRALLQTTCKDGWRDWRAAKWDTLRLSRALSRNSIKQTRTRQSGTGLVPSSLSRRQRRDRRDFAPVQARFLISPLW